MIFLSVIYLFLNNTKRFNNGYESAGAHISTRSYIIYLFTSSIALLILRSTTCFMQSLISLRLSGTRLMYFHSFFMYKLFFLVICSEISCRGKQTTKLFVFLYFVCNLF